jgi:hypothetical protein
MRGIAIAGLAGALALAMAAGGASAQQTIIDHDAWLNIDFINKTTKLCTNFEVIVANPNFVPPQYFGAPFNVINVQHGEFLASHPGNETMITFSGGMVNPDGLLHVGMQMTNSGRILNAYWTDQFGPVPVVPGGPQSIAISYEITQVRTGSDPAIHFELWMPPEYYRERLARGEMSPEAGWTKIRTFRNIPASKLGLEDLNRELFVNHPELSAYEVTPWRGIPGYPGKGSQPIQLTDEFMMGGPDSFFDVFVDVVLPEFSNPDFESLLVCEVLNAGEPIGMFWNLNPQCPEPGSMLLLAAGAGLSVLRRRRAKA